MATRIFVLINILVYVLITLVGLENPLFVSQVYATFGLVPYQVINDGAIWQIVTAMFVHSHSFLLHIVFNMLALWSLGRYIETRIGTPTFIWLYFLSGLSSGILIVGVPWILNWTEMMGRSTIGASGAVLGLLGALYVLAPNSRMLILFFPMKVRHAVLLIAGGSIILTYWDYNSVVSHLGHLGGLLGGILYTRMIVQRYLEEAKKSKLSSVSDFEKADIASPSTDKNNSIDDSTAKENREESSLVPPSTSTSSDSAPVLPVLPTTPSTPLPGKSPENTSKKILVFDAKTGKFHYK